MSPEPQPCSADLIERFLDDRLSAQEMAALENHLDSCLECRRELEVRAADESWWSQARDCLASSGCGAAGTGPPGEVTPAWPGVPPETAPDLRSSLAAIKPYLAPTDDPRMMGRVGPYEVVGVVGSG